MTSSGFEMPPDQKAFHKASTFDRTPPASVELPWPWPLSDCFRSDSTLAFRFVDPFLVVLVLV